MKVLRIAKDPRVSLIFNFAYAIGNCIVGTIVNSWWFITVGAYYGVLAATRFSVLKIKRKAGGKRHEELSAKRITGVLLIVLSFCLIGVNILSAIKERGRVFHEIVMIAIAAYTFCKITIAIVGMIKAKHTASPIIKTLRNISLAEAFVSVYSLQRSMLVSFPGMETAQIQLFNILTGSAVWLIVLFLGINLIGGKCVNMAKSKIVKANEKIADAVCKGYKKVEKGVVNTYTKIEDKFVDAYLKKDGETIEEAKTRLKKENK